MVGMGPRSGRRPGFGAGVGSARPAARRKPGVQVVFVIDHNAAALGVRRPATYHAILLKCSSTETAVFRRWIGSHPRRKAQLAIASELTPKLLLGIPHLVSPASRRNAVNESEPTQRDAWTPDSKCALTVGAWGGLYRRVRMALEKT